MLVDFSKILADSSRKLAELATSLVLEEPERIKALTEIMMEDQDPISSRASRVVALCSEQFPELFDKQQNQIIHNLHKVKSAGVIRNVLKIAADNAVTLTKKNEGILLGLCFDWIADMSKPVAIRVHAMQIIYNTSLHEADIKDELISILEECYADGSMGFRSRADKILKKLHR